MNDSMIDEETIQGHILQCPIDCIAFRLCFLKQDDDDAGRHQHHY